MLHHLPGADGLDLAVHELGSGPPLLCLPGGPANSSAYLGDLGGLTAQHKLLLVDPRGTGASAPRLEPGSFDLDAQVADVEAVRTGLGLSRLTVLAHSAGGRVALEWAAAHPDRVAGLVLATSVARWDPDVDAARVAVGRLRAGEPWYAAAAEAAFALGEARAAERRRLELLTRPFWYARWGPREQAHSAALDSTTNVRAALALRAQLRTRPLADLAGLGSTPALLIAGEWDTAAPPAAVRRLAALLPRAEVHELAGVSHFPWLDDAGRWRSVVSEFLDRIGPSGGSERSAACGWQ